MTWSAQVAYRHALLAARSPDGGFGPRPGLPSEPEPTALAALALDDEEARGWLATNQRTDGTLAMSLGSVENDAATALASLALTDPARARALDAVEATQAASFPSTPAIPFDDRLRGWPWTRDAFGWVEPTAHAVLALRLLRPESSSAVNDGIGLLRDRECVGGGWNYGNRVVLDEELPPFAQPTAVAMLALQDVEDAELWQRGMTTLRRLWRLESAGGLSLAVASAALRANRDPDAAACAAALSDNFSRTRFSDDVVALAWAVIATGPGLDRLEVQT